MIGQRHNYFMGWPHILVGFLVVQADKVTYLMGGKNFQGAHLAVAIMVFYPIHQTYGQLSGPVFLATGETARFRNIGIIFMLLACL